MIVLDSDSPIAPYEQIRVQFALQIADGVLPAGAKLPTVRDLAAELGLAVNTVARSFRELEAAGLVETRGRGGTVVTARGDQARERVLGSAQAYVAVARENGITAAEALRIVTAALEDR